MAKTNIVGLDGRLDELSFDKKEDLVNAIYGAFKGQERRENLRGKLCAVEYVERCVVSGRYSGGACNVKYYEFFFLGDAKYVSSDLVVPIGKMRNPQTGEVKNQVMQTYVVYPNIEPTFKKSNQEKDFRHSINESSDYREGSSRRSDYARRHGYGDSSKTRYLPERIIFHRAELEKILEERKMCIDDIHPNHRDIKAAV